MWAERLRINILISWVNPIIVMRDIFPERVNGRDIVRLSPVIRQVSERRLGYPIFVLRKTSVFSLQSDASFPPARVYCLTNGSQQHIEPQSVILSITMKTFVYLETGVCAESVKF